MAKAFFAISQFFAVCFRVADGKELLCRLLADGKELADGKVADSSSGCCEDCLTCDICLQCDYVSKSCLDTWEL